MYGRVYKFVEICERQVKGEYEKGHPYSLYKRTDYVLKCVDGENINIM